MVVFLKYFVSILAIMIAVIFSICGIGIILAKEALSFIGDKKNE